MPNAVYLSAGPWSEPSIITVPELPTAVASVTDVAMDELAGHYDRIFHAHMNAMEKGAFSPAGSALFLYHRISGDQPPRVDGELGFWIPEPLAAPVDVNDVQIQASTLPAGEVMALTYLGGYDGLSGAWATLMAAIVEAGQEPSVPFWEVYVTEPSPDADPATMRTDLYCLLA